MTAEKSESKYGKKRWHESYNDSFGWVYCLGIVGSAVYYIQLADTFWMGVLGVLKAFIWPAMLLYKVFTLLGM